uniref:NADH dehydrogenase subunit 6 n=1 Tax=Anaspides richardsoni TaxID=2043561 RepID=UPI002A804C8F|nr:NADH dehydrogenase subunit 6 [Anaspides richardsoni]WOR81015.1 NADH dehydrogenase subunit 6 [Anaspides richardsoni]
MFFLFASFTITFFLSLTFLLTNHPLSMGLTLLTQTCFICVTSGMINLTFWFSYILFLIFLGGMLVLFIYVASLASNEMFKMSFTFLFLLGVAVIFFFMFYLFSDFLMFYIDSLDMSSSNLNFTSQLSNQNLISFIYAPSIMFYTLFMVFYLLLTLIVAVKITNNFQGPLRFYL